MLVNSLLIPAHAPGMHLKSITLSSHVRYTITSFVLVGGERLLFKLEFILHLLPFSDQHFVILLDACLLNL
jgi:hypothetical protein